MVNRVALRSMTYRVFNDTTRARSRVLLSWDTELNLNRCSGTRAYAYVILHVLNHIRKQRHDTLQSRLALRACCWCCRDIRGCGVSRGAAARGSWTCEPCISATVASRSGDGSGVSTVSTATLLAATHKRQHRMARQQRSLERRPNAQFVGSRLEPTPHSSDRPLHVPSGLIAWRCLRCAHSGSIATGSKHRRMR